MSLVWALIWLCLVQEMQLLPADNWPKEHTVDGTSASCSQVKAFFVQHNLTEAQLTSHFITGSTLTVCESSETCCTPSMETILLKGTSRAFREALNQAGLSFKESFASAVTDIESKFVAFLKDSMQRTRARFAQLSDDQFSRFARGPIAELFKRLATYTTTQPTDIDVSQSISTFFDDIYAYLYARDSPDYALCVRRTKQELRPFGEIPRRLSLSVSRNLGALRALLVSLRLAAEAVSESSNADLTNECATALLRATSCAQCRGYSPAIRACHGLCANVARGCLAQVADVNQPWNELLEYMEKTINFLTEGRSGQTDILASVADRLSEAVLHALENAPMLEKKVRKICGEPSPAGSIGTQGQTEKADDDLTAHDGTSSSGDELNSRLRSLLPVLASARGFFATLPDLVCSDKGNRFSNQADTQCWNGQRLDEYTKPVIGTGTSAQKYNPEVRVSRSDIDANFVQLSDKLRHARQMMLSKTTISPDPDSLLMADFGSGSGDGDGDGVHWPTGIDPDSETPVSRVSPTRNNDEDEGSGSGDGEITKDPYDPHRPRQGQDGEDKDKDLDFDAEETTVRTTAKTPGSTASKPGVSLFNGVLSIAVSILCWGSLRWF